MSTEGTKPSVHDSTDGGVGVVAKFAFIQHLGVNGNIPPAAKKEGLKKIDQSELQETVFLKSGGQKKVYQCKWNGNSYIRYEPVSDDPSRLSWFVNEIETLQRLQHSNILKIVADCSTKDTRSFLVSDHGQTILQYISPLFNSLFENPHTTYHVAGLIRQLASGVKYLHQSKIIHQDLKPQNILVSNNTVTIIDLGLSCSTETAFNHAKDLKGNGSVRYMAPEQRRSSQDVINIQADMFSLGCILVHIFSGRPPWNSIPSSQFLDSTIPPLPEKELSLIPQYLGSYIESLLSEDPFSRPTAAKFLVWAENFEQKCRQNAEKVQVCSGPFQQPSQFVMGEDEPSSRSFSKIFGEKAKLKPTTPYTGPPLVKVESLFLRRKDRKAQILVKFSPTGESVKPDRAPINLAVVLDNSGSMEGDSIEFCKKAVKQIIQELSPGDSFHLITYNSEATDLVINGNLRDKPALIKVVDSIQARAHTKIGAGLSRGYSVLKQYMKTNNRVFFFSDGWDDYLEKARQPVFDLVRQNRLDGIGTTAFGVGIYYDQEMLRGISGHGSGGYHFLTNEASAVDFMKRSLKSLTGLVAFGLDFRMIREGSTIVKRVLDFPHGAQEGVFLGDMSTSDTKQIVIEVETNLNDQHVLSYTLEMRSALTDGDSIQQGYIDADDIDADGIREVEVAVRVAQNNEADLAALKLLAEGRMNEAAILRRAAVAQCRVMLNQDRTGRLNGYLQAHYATVQDRQWEADVEGINRVLLTNNIETRLHNNVVQSIHDGEMKTSTAHPWLQARHWKGNKEESGPGSESKIPGADLAPDANFITSGTIFPTTTAPATSNITSPAIANSGDATAAVTGSTILPAVITPHSDATTDSESPPTMALPILPLCVLL